MRKSTIWIADAHRGDGKRFVVRAGARPFAPAADAERQRASPRWYAPSDTMSVPVHTVSMLILAVERILDTW